MGKVKIALGVIGGLFLGIILLFGIAIVAYEISHADNIDVPDSVAMNCMLADISWEQCKARYIAQVGR